MKLIHLKSILHSTVSDVLMCVVWDSKNCIALHNKCSVEYAIANYGKWFVDRIYQYETDFVISIHE